MNRIEKIKTMISNKFEDTQKEVYANSKNIQNEEQLIVFQNETLNKFQKLIPLVYGIYENVTFSEQREINNFSIEKLNSLHKIYGQIINGLNPKT